MARPRWCHVNVRRGQERFPEDRRYWRLWVSFHLLLLVFTKLISSSECSRVGKTSILERYVNRRFSTTYKATIGADFLVKDVQVGDINLTLQVRERGSPRAASWSPILFTLCVSSPLPDMGHSWAREIPKVRDLCVCSSPFLPPFTLWSCSGVVVFYTFTVSLRRTTGARTRAFSCLTRQNQRCVSHSGGCAVLPWCFVVCFARATTLVRLPGSQSFSSLSAWRDEFLHQGIPKDPETFPFVVVGNKCDLVDEVAVTTEAAEVWCASNGIPVRSAGSSVWMLSSLRSRLSLPCVTSQASTLMMMHSLAFAPAPSLLLIFPIKP